MHWLPACPANRFSQTLHQALHTLDVDGVAYASASVAAAAVLLSSNLGTPLPLSSCKSGRQMHSEPTKAKLTIHKSCNVVSHKIHILVYGLKAANMPVHLKGCKHKHNMRMQVELADFGACSSKMLQLLQIVADGASDISLVACSDFGLGDICKAGFQSAQILGNCMGAFS